MKIYCSAHKMIFLHVQRPKAIYVYGFKSVEEPVKAKTMGNFFNIYAACKQKRDFN